MSRVQVNGEQYELVFGVDHVTGAFVQLWAKPISMQDRSAVKIDSFGVDIDDEQRGDLTPEVIRFAESQQERFDNWYSSGRLGRPNIDAQIVIGLAAVAGGFEDIAAEVYNALN